MSTLRNSGTEKATKVHPLRCLRIQIKHFSLLCCWCIFAKVALQARLYQALSKVLLFSRNLGSWAQKLPVQSRRSSVCSEMRRTTSLEVYQDSNTLCRLTATVVFLSRGNRIPIKIPRYSSFRMATSGVTRFQNAPRREKPHF